MNCTEYLKGQQLAKDNQPCPANACKDFKDGYLSGIEWYEMKNMEYQLEQIATHRSLGGKLWT